MTLVGKLRGGAAQVGRLVMNHHTHMEGLIPVLRRVLDSSSDVQSIVPGRIEKCRGHRENFSVCVTVPTPVGFKLVARKSKTAQEVFVVTGLERGELEDLVHAATQKEQGCGGGKRPRGNTEGL